MANNPISPFQTTDWNIVSFNYTRGMLYIPADVSHKWTLKAHIEKLESQDETLRAIVDISFKMVAEHEGNQVMMNGQCFTLCSLITEGIDNVEEQFERLTKTTAMINSLANLRVFLMQQGALLQSGQKRVMLPFINLNNFQFDEDVVFTV